MHRRAFLRSAAAGLCTLDIARAQQSLEPWKSGTLDIHHLAYGRGNSTFILGPDGTTILIDAGATEDSFDVSAAQKPNDSVRPGVWIANYLLRQMQPAERREIDYCLITHIHPDHIDAIMDVEALVPIRTLIDRGFPDYAYPRSLDAPFTTNYLKFVKSRQQRWASCDRFRVGRADQIRTRTQYPNFTIRNLAANGEVWTGIGNTTRQCFPDLKTLKDADYPTENMCSAAIRLTYGKFDYFTGGDLTCDTADGDQPWRDIETPVARACGPVEVAVANHHAYFDAVGPGFTRALRPQVMIVPAWYVAHPSIVPLRRMVDVADVFATNVMHVNRLVNNQFITKLKSVEGHIVVRVAPGGDEYRVLIVDNSDDTGRVKATFGPYPCL